MGAPLASQSELLDGVIKSAQYLAALLSEQEVWSEVDQMLRHFFRADLVAVIGRQPDGAFRSQHCKIEGGHSCKLVFDACKKMIEEVVETDFLASECIGIDDQAYAVVVLPLPEKGRESRVLLIGHLGDSPIPHNILNVYLAMAGLCGTTLARIHSERRLQRLADNVPEMLFQLVVYTPDSYRFSYASPGTELVLGLPADTLLASPDTFLAGFDKSQRAAFRAAFLESPPAPQIREMLLWRDRHIQISASSRQDDNGVLFWYGVADDVSEIEAAREELRQARDKAEAANRAKSTFLANMSHELRTPLNAVLGFAQILEHDERLAPEQRTNAKSIVRGGEHLLTLISDILDLAKIEAGRFELFPQVFYCHEFFNALSEFFELRARQKGLSYRYKAMTALPRTLYCDNKRLRQIVINLLGNAVKFTERGGVMLRSGFADGRLELEVEDTGSGIEAEELETIFEPFVQLGEILQKHEGTGLGLAITRQLVEAMDGKLSVQSTPGRGSTFRVQIPLPNSPEEAVQIRQVRPKLCGYRRTRGEGPLRILLVEDLHDNRQVLRQLLEPLGFEIEEAENGRVCLEIAPAWQPDMILMDLSMPELDGLAATRALREMPKFFATPIVAVSASAFGEDCERSLAAGCNRHLAKPVKLYELAEALAAYLPLEWEYQVSGPSTGSTGATLDREKCELILALTQSGDVMKLLEYLRGLAETADCPAEVPQLLELAESFRLSELKEILVNSTNRR